MTTHTVSPDEHGRLGCLLALTTGELHHRGGCRIEPKALEAWLVAFLSEADPTLAALASWDIAIEGEELLTTDVVAIRANQDLVARLLDGSAPGSQLEYAPLLRAWRSLPKTYRLVWRRWYCLDGMRRSSLTELGAALGMNATAVSKIDHRVLGQLRESLWPTHEFHGLDARLLGILMRVPVHTVREVRDHANLILRDGNWGPPRFAALDAWFIGHGHGSLVPYLDQELRAKFEI